MFHPVSEDFIMSVWNPPNGRVPSVAGEPSRILLRTHRDHNTARSDPQLGPDLAAKGKCGVAISARRYRR